MTESNVLPNWGRLLEERLIEAKQMRQRVEAIADKLLALRREFPRTDASRDEKRREYQLKANQFFRLWVESDEAKRPDPRTGKSNQRWRDGLWHDALAANAELQALKAVAEQERPGGEEVTIKESLLMTEMVYLRARMDLLAAELRALARG